ncbi:MAG: hypothetical protein AAF968_06410 [Pseudomonadota bacterium]
MSWIDDLDDAVPSGLGVSFKAEVHASLKEHLLAKTLGFEATALRASAVDAQLPPRNPRRRPEVEPVTSANPIARTGKDRAAIVAKAAQ